MLLLHRDMVAAKIGNKNSVCGILRVTIQKYLVSIEGYRIYVQFMFP